MSDEFGDDGDRQKVQSCRFGEFLKENIAINRLGDIESYVEIIGERIDYFDAGVELAGV